MIKGMVGKPRTDALRSLAALAIPPPPLMGASWKWSEIIVEKMCQKTNQIMQ